MAGKQIVERRTVHEPVVHPRTGEILDLSKVDDDVLAEAVHEIRENKKRADSMIAAAGEEIVRRMDKTGTWTHLFGQYEVSAPSPEPTREIPDPEKLRRTLAKLIRDDVIDKDAAAAALERVVTMKVKWGGMNRLLKIPEARAAIEPLIELVPKEKRPVTVKLGRPEQP